MKKTSEYAMLLSGSKARVRMSLDKLSMHAMHRISGANLEDTAPPLFASSMFSLVPDDKALLEERLQAPNWPLLQR